jgi:hypothetical protein
MRRGTASTFSGSTCPSWFTIKGLNRIIISRSTLWRPATPLVLPAELVDFVVAIFYSIGNVEIKKHRGKNAISE